MLTFDLCYYVLNTHGTSSEISSSSKNVEDESRSRAYNDICARYFTSEAGKILKLSSKNINKPIGPEIDGT